MNKNDDEDHNHALAKELESSLDQYRAQIAKVLNGLSIDTALMIIERARTELNDRRSEEIAIKSGTRFAELLKVVKRGGE